MYIMLTDTAITSIITATAVLLGATISPLVLMFSDKIRNGRIDTKEKKKIAQELIEVITDSFLLVHRELINIVSDYKLINPATEESNKQFIKSIDELVDVIILLRKEHFHKTIYRIPKNLYSEMAEVILAWKELLMSVNYSNSNNFLGIKFEAKNKIFEDCLFNFFDECRDFLEN